MRAPTNLPDRRLTPPEAAIGPAPVCLTCSGRGSLDAGGQPLPTTHPTAVRVPFPAHHEEPTMLRDAFRILARDPLYFAVELILFASFFVAIFGGLAVSAILFPELFP